ncbi:ABC transporter ATP-binding protein [Pseudobacillus badius]|uniref:ABC transporter ATP-binding protein n=1 Tax=Bacillus badius TaxID=1455 RepID=UPI003CF5CAD8
MNNAIELEQVKFSVKDKEILKGVSFSVPQSSIFSLLGHNGSGKTTLIRIILNLVRKKSGTIKILGDAQEKGMPLHKIGVVFDQPSLFDHLNAIDNLRFYGELYGLHKKDLNVKIKNELEGTPLWERRKEPVKMWSLGMRQRLAVIRSCITNPDILILDEPSSGLDPEVLNWLHSKLIELKENGSTIIFTTHNLSEAESLSDYFAILQDGKVLESGATNKSLQEETYISKLSLKDKSMNQETRKLLNNEFQEEIKVSLRGQYLMIEWPDEPKLNLLLNFLMSKGVEIKEIKEQKKSLKEVYLSHTKGVSNDESNSNIDKKRF